MLHRLHEEHEVHARKGLVVLGQFLREDLGELHLVGHLEVGLDVLIRLHGEIGEGEGPFEQHVLVKVLKEVFGGTVDHVFEARSVGHVDEPIAVHAERLVQPEARQVHGLDKVVGCALEDALEDAAHLTQVPRVVEGDGRRHERVGHELVQHEGRVGHALARLLHLLRKAVRKVALEDSAIDGAQHLRLRRERREGGKVALHAVLNGKGACSRIHRAQVLHAADLLHGELLEVVEAAVLNLLVQQGDGGLRAVLVGRGHVHVVDKVDEALGARRREHGACLLLERLLEDRLERARDGEGVEVDVEIDDLLG